MHSEVRESERVRTHRRENLCCRHFYEQRVLSILFVEGEIKLVIKNFFTSILPDLAPGSPGYVRNVCQLLTVTCG